MKTEIGRCKDVVTGKVSKYKSLDMITFTVSEVDYSRSDFDEKYDLVDYEYNNTDSGVTIKFKSNRVMSSYLNGKLIASFKVK